MGVNELPGVVEGCCAAAPVDAWSELLLDVLEMGVEGTFFLLTYMSLTPALL